MSDDCLFCKILKKEIPSKIRYEDDKFLAFDDISPKAKTHILVIPKKHIHSVAALDKSDEQLLGELIITAKKIAANEKLPSYRLVTNSGRDAGQAIDHLHIHILGGSKLGDIA